jgi:hypothetical protein
MIGQTFGRLTVLGVSAHVGGRPGLLCRCECGAEVPVQRKKLVSGHTQSCGCLQKQRARENVKIGHKLSTTHKLTGTKEFEAWMSMKARVTYDNPVSGKHYRKKGIKISPEWLNDFPTFLAHIGHAPSAAHTVDRIDSNGHYEPGNVRWSTYTEQNRNKADNIIISWRGQERLLIEVVEELGLPYQTIHYRIQRAGWTVNRALTEPIHQTGRWPTANRRQQL